MAGTAFTNPTAGYWPLGKITVAVPGTPVAVNTNVGKTKGDPTVPNQMSKRARAFIFSGMLTTTLGKQMYVCKKGYAKGNTNGIVAVIPAATAATAPVSPVMIPPGGMLDGVRVTPDDLFLDADEVGASCFVTAIYE